MQIAIRYETPLLFWGESLAEYQSFYSYDEMEEVDEKRFNRAFRQVDAQSFVRTLADGARPFPAAHRLIKAVNMGLAEPDELRRARH